MSLLAVTLAIMLCTLDALLRAYRVRLGRGLLPRASRERPVPRQRWLEILWKTWRPRAPYDNALHLANQAKHGS